MIGFIEFNGYRIFEGTTHLSFYADLRTKRFLSNSLDLDNRSVLKSVGIYGGNNSGKTNLIDLLSGLKKVLSGAVIGLAFNNPLFHDPEPLEVTIEFNNRDGIGWLRYAFAYENGRGFIKEELTRVTYYAAGAPNLSSILLVDNAKGEFRLFGKDGTALLSLYQHDRPILFSIGETAEAYPAIKPYAQALRSFSTSLDIVRMYNIPIEGTIQAMKGEDEPKKRFIESFVKHADLVIDSFGYDQNASIKVQRVGEAALQTGEEAFRLFTDYLNHGQRVHVPSIVFDSSGTKKIEAIASYVYDGLRYGKTLIVDELDNGLHFSLSRAIVNCFSNIGNKRGQLLFTGHDLSLLDSPSTMRKDQIYFLDRSPSGARLHCLRSDKVRFGGPREGESLAKRYKHGDFVPLPYPDFTEDLISVINGLPE